MPRSTEARNIPGTAVTNSRTTPPRPVAFSVDTRNISVGWPSRGERDPAPNFAEVARDRAAVGVQRVGKGLGREGGARDRRAADHAAPPTRASRARHPSVEGPCSIHRDSPS